MRCRNAIKQIGPYIDGELTAAKSEELRQHFHSCVSCSRRYALLRGLVRELSYLPPMKPTPEESFRLMNRVRREISEAREPAVPRVVSRRSQLAGAAISLLVVATVAGLSLAVLSRGPTTVTDGTASEVGRSSDIREGVEPDESQASEQPVVPGPITAAAARPTLVISGNEYTEAELEGFRNDVGTRLDFYSAYWYPASGSGVVKPDFEQLQADLTSDLVEQAAASGSNPDELERAVNAALVQSGDDHLLPCYAELVLMDGREAWLVSVSGPEDYLLFTDPKRPPAFMLASLGGTESLKISESLLRELAAMLAPSSNGGMTVAPAGTSKEKGETARDEAAPEETAPAPETAAEEALREKVEQQVEDDFRTFLRKLSAQGTSLDLISALKDLNYRQILLLLHGDWASLVADGVDLSDFLTPPKRLWAVDCASGEILWASR